MQQTTLPANKRRFDPTRRLYQNWRRIGTLHSAPVHESVAEPVAAIAMVGDQRSRLWQAGEQRLCVLVITHLPGGEVQQDRPAWAMRY